MTKNNKFLIILLTILNSLLLIKCNELLELVCSGDMDCNQFNHSYIISSCHKGYCICTAENGGLVQCKPLNYQLNNIIGGPCPCYQDDAECDYRETVCYCKRGFIPSTDKRRCIRKVASLNEWCEEDSQCQGNDFNSVCNQQFHRCYCKDQFVVDEGKCTSVLDNKFRCVLDPDCTEKYDANAKCAFDYRRCVCTSNHYASINSSICLKSMKYSQTCNETIQCIDALGLGGKCEENLCQCADKYFFDVKRSPMDTRQTVCTPFNKPGQYCRYDKDCYEHHLIESHQTMICKYGECNCKMGYNINKHNECVRDSAADINLSMLLTFITFFIVFVNKLF